MQKTEKLDDARILSRFTLELGLRPTKRFHYIFRFTATQLVTMIRKTSKIYMCPKWVQNLNLYEVSYSRIIRASLNLNLYEISVSGTPVEGRCPRTPPLTGQRGTHVEGAAPEPLHSGRRGHISSDNTSVSLNSREHTWCEKQGFSKYSPTPTFSHLVDSSHKWEHFQYHSSSIQLQ